MEILNGYKVERDIIMSGTWTAFGTVTLPAVTLGGTVAISGQSFSGDTIITQAGLTTAILSFQSSSVATGLTTGTNILDVVTSNYGVFSKFAALTGGLLVQALGENAAVATNLLFESYGGQADTTKSTAGRALIEVYAAQHNGANALAAVAANGNIFAIRGHTVNTVAIVDEDGDLWLNGRITVGAQSPNNYVGNDFSYAFTSDGASSIVIGNIYASTLTGASGDTTYQVGSRMANQIVTQTVAETIGYVAQVAFVEPVITKNVTAITVASTIYVVNAPTEGVTNAAIYVASGDTNIKTLTLGGTVTGGGQNWNNMGTLQIGTGSTLQKAMSGDIVLACSPSTAGTSAATLNAAAAGTHTQVVTINLQDAAAALHKWASLAVAAATSEVVADVDVAAPAVNDATPNLVAGTVNVTLTYDTDGGATKTYAAGDTVTLTISDPTDGILGWSVSDATFVDTIVA